MSTALPDPELADADQDLRVLGLRQDEVERALRGRRPSAAPCSAGWPCRSPRPSGCGRPSPRGARTGTSRRGWSSGRRRARGRRGRCSSAITDWKSWTARFARYWSSLSAPTGRRSRTASDGPERLARRIDGSGRRRHVGARSHRAYPPTAAKPDARRQAKATVALIAIQRTCIASPPISCSSRQLADQRLDREAERPLERQEVRELLGPLRHQRAAARAARTAAAPR